MGGPLVVLVRLEDVGKPLEVLNVPFEVHIALLGAVELLEELYQ